MAAGILTNAWFTSPWLDCAENNPPWIFVAAAPTLTLSHGEEGLGQAGMRTGEGLIILVEATVECGIREVTSKSDLVRGKVAA